MCITREEINIESTAPVLHPAELEPGLSHGLPRLGGTLPGHGHRGGTARPGGAGVAPVLQAHSQAGLRAGLSRGLHHPAHHQQAARSMVAVMLATITTSS